MAGRSTHEFFGHARWPHLGASIDGIAALPEELDFDPTIFSNPGLVEVALEEVMAFGGVGLIEIKSTNDWSFKKTWLNRIPDYYQYQPMMQMALTCTDWCLVVCGDGQDMTCHAVTREDDFGQFEELLDSVDVEFAELLEKEAA